MFSERDGGGLCESSIKPEPKLSREEQNHELIQNLRSQIDKQSSLNLQDSSLDNQQLEPETRNLEQLISYSDRKHQQLNLCDI